MTQLFIGIFIVIALAGGLWLLSRRFGETKHRLTTPELRNQALQESERLSELVGLRESNRPPDDPVIQDDQLEHRRFSSHDEETREIYKNEYMPKVVELKKHFAARRIRNEMLDELHDSVGNEADLRTISTALQEMAGRLKKS